jgi:energy-coupling factor transporter ATP-binding protein EcfA2
MKDTLKDAALRLIRDPRFLYRLGHQLRQLGVVGEERNRLVLALAGIGRSLENSASVIVKGSTSSGKSTLVKKAALLFPKDSVLERASLSPKALAHGKGSLAGKILVLNEYRGAKDALLLLRLLQSEGRVEHEYTTVRGSKRGTETAMRVGTPVVFTTTTHAKVFEDDETRFLSLWSDETPEQSLAILIAKATKPQTIDYKDLPLWRKALSLVASKKNDFENPPGWLRYVAEHLPLGNIRVRRDWDRFLSLCQAVALCRGAWQRERPVNITFKDYAVAFRILDPVFSSTLQGLRTQELELSKAVSSLNRRLERSVTTKEIATELKWKEPVVYKHLKSAQQKGLIDFEPGTRESNRKLVRASEQLSVRFLPSPRQVLRSNPEIGEEVSFIDPFTGAREILRIAKK